MTTVACPIIEQIPLTAIRTDGGTQPRAQMDLMYVAELAQAIQDGANIPAIITYYDGSDYWLADGFHRYGASRQLDRETIVAEVRRGTRRDAILCSAGANATHGLRRTNADKRRAVETLLRDKEWAYWSDREIARRCGVDHVFVGRIRSSLVTITSDERTYMTKHGTVATMNTSNIGHAAPKGFLPFLPASTEEAEGEEDSYNFRYDRSKPASCKYCYQTHNDWELSGNHDGTVWICGNCDHATRDEFMQIEDVEPAEEQQAFYRNQIEIPIKVATIVKNPALAALQSSESNEWFTPEAYVEAARELMGAIDVDPASCEVANRIVKATRYHTKEDNGLLQSWRGRVWLNPPYGFGGGISNQETWTNQLIERYEAGLVSEAVLLVNANTEAKWFQPLYNYLICFTNHRIRFYNADGTPSQPTQGNALVYFGKQQRRFIELFSQFGRIVREARADEY